MSAPCGLRLIGAISLPTCTYVLFLLLIFQRHIRAPARAVWRQRGGVAQTLGRPHREGRRLCLPTNTTPIARPSHGDGARGAVMGPITSKRSRSIHWKPLNGVEKTRSRVIEEKSAPSICRNVKQTWSVLLPDPLLVISHRQQQGWENFKMASTAIRIHGAFAKSRSWTVDSRQYEQRHEALTDLCICCTAVGYILPSPKLCP
jgi:hypothetical protein